MQAQRPDTPSSCETFTARRIYRLRLCRRPLQVAKHREIRGGGTPWQGQKVFQPVAACGGLWQPVAACGGRWAALKNRDLRILDLRLKYSNTLDARKGRRINDINKIIF